MYLTCSQRVFVNMACAKACFNDRIIKDALNCSFVNLFYGDKVGYDNDYSSLWLYSPTGIFRCLNAICSTRYWSQIPFSLLPGKTEKQDLSLSYLWWVELNECSLIMAVREPGHHLDISSQELTTWRCLLQILWCHCKSGTLGRYDNLQSRKKRDEYIKIIWLQKQAHDF